MVPLILSFPVLLILLVKMQDIMFIIHPPLTPTLQSKTPRLKTQMKKNLRPTKFSKPITLKLDTSSPKINLNAKPKNVEPLNLKY